MPHKAMKAGVAAAQPKNTTMAKAITSTAGKDTKKTSYPRTNKPAGAPAFNTVGISNSTTPQITSMPQLQTQPKQDAVIAQTSRPIERPTESVQIPHNTLQMPKSPPKTSAMPLEVQFGSFFNMQAQQTQPGAPKHAPIVSQPPAKDPKVSSVTTMPQMPVSTQLPLQQTMLPPTASLPTATGQHIQTPMLPTASASNPTAPKTMHAQSVPQMQANLAAQANRQGMAAVSSSAVMPGLGLSQGLPQAGGMSGMDANWNGMSTNMMGGMAGLGAVPYNPHAPFMGVSGMQMPYAGVGFDPSTDPRNPSMQQFYGDAINAATPSAYQQRDVSQTAHTRDSPHGGSGQAPGNHYNAVRGDTKQVDGFNSRSSQRTGLPTSDTMTSSQNTAAGQAVGSTHSAQMQQPPAQFMNSAMYPMGAMGFPMNAPPTPYGYNYFAGPGIPGQPYGAQPGQFAVQHDAQNLDSRQSGGGGYGNKQTPMNQYDAQQLHQGGQYMSHMGNGLAHGQKASTQPKPAATAVSTGGAFGSGQGKADDTMFAQQSNSFGYNAAPTMQQHYGGAQFMHQAAAYGRQPQPQQFNTQQGGPFWTPSS